MSGRNPIINFEIKRKDSTKMEHSSAKPFASSSSSSQPRQIQSDRMAQLIQEQAQLLKHFEESARAERTPDSFVEVDVSALMDDPEMIREQQRLYASFQTKPVASKKMNDDKVKQFHEDTTHHLKNGQKIRMKGMKQVYQSISRGCAVLVKCPHCETVLQVDKNASKAVYCVMCQQISHVDLMSPSLTAGGDGLLAKALQLQEAQATQIKAKQY